VELINNTFLTEDFSIFESSAVKLDMFLLVILIISISEFRNDSILSSIASILIINASAPRFDS